MRCRWAAAVTSVAVLGALALAASSIQLGDPRAESLANAGPEAGGRCGPDLLDPNLQGGYGSDGTRTRDLRRDRPAF